MIGDDRAWDVFYRQRETHAAGHGRVKDKQREEEWTATCSAVEALVKGCASRGKSALLAVQSSGYATAARESMRGEALRNRHRELLEQ